MARGRQKARLGEVGVLELTGALFDLALEGRIGLLKLGRHAVKLIAQRLELVTGFDRYALAEIAAADAGRAIAQGADRNHHPAGEKEPGKHGDDQGATEESARSPDRRIERRVGFV